MGKSSTMPSISGLSADNLVRISSRLLRNVSILVYINFKILGVSETESYLHLGRPDTDKDEPDEATDASDSTLEGLKVLEVSLSFPR